VNKATSHRAGFVALGGRSNVGKSTLLNRLVGHKVAIVTPKPQTTRRRVVGIRTDPDAQIVFIDTPGIHASDRLLNQRMVKAARRGLGEGEVVAAVVEAAGRLGREDRAFVAETGAIARPKILVVNKIDLVGRDTLLGLLEECARELPGAEIVPVSALSGENVGELLKTIKAMLPKGPALMPEDQYTNETERALAAELIREKLLLKVRDEIPFSTAVAVERFVEEPEKNLVRVSAVIIVERDSHKGIVIGAGGRMLKEIGTAARLELEEIFGRRVFLELFVRVERGWTKNPRKLDELGL
jgi:GTPase